MKQDEIPCCEPVFWVYLIICLVLVSFAGLTSGLALGLLSFSQVDLEVIIKAGQPNDRNNAAKILPIVKKEHLLLCTLLISKTLAMEALPIFLDMILPSWGAILMSVTLVLAFGEIIPQAVCSRFGLSVGANLSTLVRILLMVLFPIAYPISKLLDWFLGKEHSVLLGRAELKTLVDLHGKESGRGGQLTREEIAIITGALDLTQKTTKDAMTPISKTFSLDINSKLDKHTMGLIMSNGHSRLPVYSGSPSNIIGLILVKNLILCRPEDETSIKNMVIRKILRVRENWPLCDILSQFQKCHSHMAVVVKCKKDVMRTAENGEGNPSMLNIKVELNSKPVTAEKKDLKSPLGLKEYPGIFRNASSQDSGTLSPASKNEDLNKWKPGNEDVSTDDLEMSLSELDDKEIIGVITLEDVLKELLQGGTFDETDAYAADVHNIIRMTLLASQGSSPISSGSVSVSHPNFKTPEQLSGSPYACGPILRSPISPYILPPLVRPTLSASPAISITKSPAAFAGPVHTSPKSHRVWRKSYDRLRQPRLGVHKAPNL